MPPPVRPVLVLNAGSSSLKWSVLEANTEAVLTDGQVSWAGSEGGRHETEVRAALRQLPPITAVGHRVVHGGSRYRSAVLIDGSVREGISQLSELAPLHNPSALAGIEAAGRVVADVPQVAAFDTAFHATIPEPAAIYPVPWAWTTRWALRRFGFHGLSVQYALRRARELVGGPGSSRLVVCHLGGGCSVTAVLDGRSVDTSMGFTPLEGLMMANRCGSVDPGLLLYLLNHGQLSPGDLERGLNERSGLLGVSGVSADWRAVQQAADAGQEQAQLAQAMFVHRLIASVGGMVATLGGLDALVFTGGIGQHSPLVRRAVCEALAFMGVRLADNEGAADGRDRNVAAGDSSVAVLVVAAREDLSILAEVRRLVWPEAFAPDC